MTTKKKKSLLKELKANLKKAWAISNNLIKEEPTHSKNNDRIYLMRNQIESAQQYATFLEYPTE